MEKKTHHGGIYGMQKITTKNMILLNIFARYKIDCRLTGKKKTRE